MRSARAYREDDAVGPRTAYGASKAAGEFLTRRHGDRHLIVRTSGVFGTTGTSNKGYTLIEKVLRQAERGEPTRMVADMIFSPSYAPHVARAVATSSTRARSARTTSPTPARAAGTSSCAPRSRRPACRARRSSPSRTPRWTIPTRRPMHSPLENTTFARAGIAPLPPWEAALDEFLAARRTRAAAGRA